MEVGNKNPFIMDQFAACYALHAGQEKRAGDFDTVLENEEELREQERSGQNAETDRFESEKDVDYRQFLLEKMEEMRANIKNGTIQPKIQIGAEAYTQEEWEKLLEKIDAAEDALQEQIEAEIAAVKEKAGEEEENSDTRIITRPDGARILLIATPFGEMSVELSGPDDSAKYSDDIQNDNLAENVEMLEKINNICDETVDNAGDVPRCRGSSTG